MAISKNDSTWRKKPVDLIEHETSLHNMKHFSSPVIVSLLAFYREEIMGGFIDTLNSFNETHPEGNFRTVLEHISQF